VIGAYAGQSRCIRKQSRHWWSWRLFKYVLVILTDV
jgi:V-type H+-transporting ATPase subunit D